jgi:hypothetical protein
VSSTIRSDAILRGELEANEEAVIWRYHEFLRLGFTATTAYHLSLSSADVETARVLIDRGCPTGLALRIL